MLNRLIAINPLTYIGSKVFSSINLLAELSQYLSNLLINNPPPNIQKILFGIGVSALSYKIVEFIIKQIIFWHWVPKHVIRNIFAMNADQWKNKYGNCYVLITGAADGIGYAYVRQFAKMKFNLILVDIQKQKLEFKKKQLLQCFPQISIQLIGIDMSDDKKMSDLINEINQYDIGIVINNVGLPGGGKYMQINPQIIKKTLNINFLPCYIINRALIPKLRSRGHRSAIINMSSGTGAFISHRVVDIYSRTLSKQNEDKIDVMSVRPFGVKTAMLKMKNNPKFITPKKCATAVLNDLGSCSTSFSSFSHKIIGAFFMSLCERKRFDAYQEAWTKYQ